jgi:hypothetical protein
MVFPKNAPQFDNDESNCSQHIPRRFEAAALAERGKRIAELEDELSRLRAGPSKGLLYRPS